MGNEQGSEAKIDFRSLPRANEAISEAYKLAFDIVQRMRIIISHRLDWPAVNDVICYYEDESSEEETARRIEEVKRKLFRGRQEKADTLLELSQMLMSELEALTSAFKPLWNLLQYSYKELGDFDAGGRNWGRCAYPAIQQLAYATHDWSFKCRRLYTIRPPEDSKKKQQKIDKLELSITNKQKIYDECEKLNNEIPLTTEIERDLRKRLYQEQGQLMRDLPAYQALIVEPSSLAYEITGAGRSTSIIPIRSFKRLSTKAKHEPKKKEVLRSFLLKHHHFEDGNLTLQAASLPDMANAVGKSVPTMSRYLRALGFEDYAHYKRICEDYQQLKVKLDLLDGKLPEEFRTNLQQSIDLKKDD